MVLAKILQLLMAHPRLGPMLINKLSDSWCLFYQSFIFVSDSRQDRLECP
jgi:hypothetical protein